MRVVPKTYTIPIVWQEAPVSTDYGSVATKDFDLNIADALDCPRGTLYLDITVGGWCGTRTQMDNEAYVEVLNLRIVVTR